MQIRFKMASNYRKSTKKRTKYAKLVQLVIWLLFSHLSVNSVNATKCYVCGFHLAYCSSPLDCYNQPDICSNTNFSPILSQVDECPFGCEQYIKTDATGGLILWRRGCATERSPRSSYICYSRVINFKRHEQCWCHSDYCNSSNKLLTNSYLRYIGLFFVMFILLMY